MFFDKCSSWARDAHLGRADLAAAIFGVCILLFAGIVTSFLLGYFTAIAQLTSQPDGVFYYPDWEYRLDRNNPKEADIMETREYQISLGNSIINNHYEPRSAGVKEMVQFLRNYTGEKLKDGSEDIYVYWEVHYDSKPCGHEFSEIRVRSSWDLDGNIIENKTTVDINQDSVPGPYKEDAMTWDLSANEIYDSEEKIEEDIHTHSHKFNRKTKVKHLPTDFTLSTCGDLLEMFPHAFDKKGNVDPNTHLPVSSKPPPYGVYEVSYSGKMYYDILKYKFSWTFYYGSVAHALNDRAKPAPSASEFSFRIYSPGEGYGPWQYEGLVYAAELYHAVQKFYGI